MLCLILSKLYQMLTGKDRLNNFLKKGEVPMGFYHHDRFTGKLAHQCVFCRKEVSEKIRHEHGYFIELFGKVPVSDPNDVRNVVLQEKGVECTICMNCDDDIPKSDEPVLDNYGFAEDFVLYGKYPEHIVDFSLSKEANYLCFLCRKDVSNEDHVIHYIPTGYYINRLESTKIPGPLCMCEECEEITNEAMRNSTYSGLDHYALDDCFLCGEKHLITKAEEEHRAKHSHKKSYLCPKCAIDKGLMGKHRDVQPSCKSCEKGLKKYDILHKSSFEKRIEDYICGECERSYTQLYTYEYTKNTRLEIIYSDGWKWLIVQIFSANIEDDKIIARSNQVFDKPENAMFHGVLYLLSIGEQLRMKL